MFRGWFKPKKKFSLENLKYLYSQLVKNPVVTESNKDHLVEVLRTIAELMIWGDQHNENFFDFFCEKGVLSFFLKILLQKCDTKVKIQVIQTLSILIQNISSETSIFYLLSNNYINDLIVHRFDFSNEELLAYYISFLKTLSLKLNSRTIQFFFNEKANDFPLYTEAIKFFKHPEAMVRVAVRTLTLNVYAVDDPGLRRFILDRSAVPYFYNLVWFLRDESLGLHAKLKEGNFANRHNLEESMEMLVDLFYYLQDILNLGIEGLCQTLIDQLLSHFILPVLVGSLHENDQENKIIDSRLALFLLSQVFLVFNHYAMVNSVATCLFDTNPPVLSELLVNSPPQYPVKAPLPLTCILFPKSSPSTNLNLSVPPADPASYVPSSTQSIISISTPETSARPPLLLGPSEPSSQTTSSRLVPPSAIITAPRPSLSRTELMSSPLQPVSPIGSPTTSPRGIEVAPSPSSLEAHAPYPHYGDLKTAPSPQISGNDKPIDENLRARSALPEIGPVYSPIQQLPDLTKRSAHNPYRSSLLRFLSSNDERLVFLSAGVFIALLRNKQADIEMFLKADICPVHYRKSKSFQLLRDLTASPVHDTETLGNSQPSTSVLGSSASIASVSSALSTQEALLRFSRYGGGGQQPVRPLHRLADNHAHFYSQLPSLPLRPINDVPEDDDGFSDSDVVSVDLLVISSAGPSSQNSTRSPQSPSADFVQVQVLITPITVYRFPRRSLDSTVTPLAKSDITITDGSPIGHQSLLSTALPNSAPQSPASPIPAPSQNAGDSETGGRRLSDPFVLKSLGSQSARVHSQSRSRPVFLKDSSPNDIIDPSDSKESAVVPKRLPFDEPFSSTAADSSQAIYPQELVRLALQALSHQPAHRLVTIQLLIELLCELLYDSTPDPCLRQQDMLLLEDAYLISSLDLRERFNTRISNLILDLFEDEWNLLNTQHTPVKDMISNTMSLLPITNSSSAGIPLEYRLPAGELESTRKSIQVFLLLRDLKFKMMKQKDLEFPLSKTEAKLQKGDIIDMTKQDAIAFTSVLGQAKTRLFLVIDPKLLLVVERHAEKAGSAVVQMAVPLRHQEVFVDRSNACVLHVTIRSSLKPHSSCLMLKGTNLRPLWNFTMYFMDRAQCSSAKRHLQRSRSLLRKQMLAQISSLLPPNDPGVIPHSDSDPSDDNAVDVSFVPSQFLPDSSSDSLANSALV